LLQRLPCFYIFVNEEISGKNEDEMISVVSWTMNASPHARYLEVIFVLDIDADFFEP
jgi:hypothetical protein